jgi:response regulator RpfG family c-di-GMP phosphodiesterase
MSERVLFVDDEPQVLEGIQRSLRKHVDMLTATSGADGLRLVRESGPFALVVSDMRMPVMTGAQFLSQVRQAQPDAVRMILSGESDLKATIEAVNEGNIYRFLSKPCAPDKLLAAVEDGLKQYRLLTGEKVLLEQTLSGSVKMLVEIVGMVSPAASRRASRLQRYVTEVAAALALPAHWEWDLAASVSQIGYVGLPKDVASKIEAAEALTEEERRLHESHPEIAAKLLAAIPRLENVAAIVAIQLAPIDFNGKCPDLQQWDTRTLGQLLLRCAVEYDRLIGQGVAREAAIEQLRGLKVGFPQAVCKAFGTLKMANGMFTVRPVHLKELAPGMILEEDVVSAKGIRLVPAGHEITRTLIVKLQSIAQGIGVSEPFRVKVSA